MNGVIRFFLAGWQPRTQFRANNTVNARKSPRRSYSGYSLSHIHAESMGLWLPPNTHRYSVEFLRGRCSSGGLTVLGRRASTLMGWNREYKQCLFLSPIPLLISSHHSPTFSLFYSHFLPITHHRLIVMCQAYESKKKSNVYRRVMKLLYLVLNFTGSKLKI